MNNISKGQYTPMKIFINIVLPDLLIQPYRLDIKIE